MKIKCDFCKTEYNLERVPSCPVQCALCGHKWSVAMPPRQNTWLVFFSALVALLSAIVFTICVIVVWDADQTPPEPLVASISDYEFVSDDTGARRLLVRGFVSNTSADLYGVPELIIVFSDEDGRELATQKIMPPATFLDAGATADFSQMLSMLPAGAKTISIKLDEMEKPTGNKK